MSRGDGMVTHTKSVHSPAIKRLSEFSSAGMRISTPIAESGAMLLRRLHGQNKQNL
ncbi:uncharacterized protein CTRU02_210851 [Colletotrichum truncatum]|uniref:Uncharacterized protein n=1 Tax=Colletotrichum truncatum TaxID=5467 RepID=A0ACC3YSC1_COLTU|nr:uncharacterized protein CTRU02_03664 [Colletotrichum truncatum]KAF6796686.1 hypothetical protein CTRU02_03664 [Colletotrichum truncatum]